MKFEALLLRFSDAQPGWPFVRYGILKALLKSGETGLPSYSFAEILIHDIKLIQTLLEMQSQAVRVTETTKGHLPPDYEDSAANFELLVRLDRPRLRSYIENIRELKEAFEQLFSYARINAKGIRGLLDKARGLGLGQDFNHAYLLKWAALEPYSRKLAHLNSMVEQINKALKLERINPDSGLVDYRVANDVRTLQEFESLKILVTRALTRTGNMASIPQLSDHGERTVIGGILIEIACADQDIKQMSALLRFIESLNGHQPSQHTLSVIMKRYCSLKLSKTDALESKRFAYFMHTLINWFFTHRPSQFVEFNEQRRIPLHYAIEFGDPSLVRRCLEAMRFHRNLNLPEVISARDFQGKTALSMAVSTNSYDIVVAVLEQLEVQSLLSSKPNKAFRDAQFTALCKGDDAIFELFLTRGIVQPPPTSGRSYLMHDAARMGNASKLKLLLSSPSGISQLNVTDSRGWTPLFFACDEGHEESVRTLVEAGAEIDVVDKCNWLASERSAYKGHLRILEYLMPLQKMSSADSLGLGKLSGAPKLRQPLAANAFDQTLVLIRLGSANLRKPVNAIAFCEETHLSFGGMQLVISLVGRSKTLCAIGVSLPTISSGAHEPMVFKTEEMTDLKLVFKLHYPDEKAEKSLRVLGTGAISLDSLRAGLFKNHEGLLRDHEVIISDSETASCIASVTFNLLTITPFNEARYAVSGKKQGFCEAEHGPAIIEHRASGANEANQRYLQIGENTIQGFLSAATLGASYIECNVQMTKDFVPVLYHDFLLKDTGSETRISTMTKQQFLNIGKVSNAKTGLPSAAEFRFEKNTNAMAYMSRKPRSRSLQAYEDSPTQDLVDWLRVTSHGSTQAVKGNRRGFAIHEPLVTLEEMFDRSPESIALDLDIKYPMLWEAEDQDFGAWAVEINLFVDTVLDMVFSRAGNRSITFSSSNPEICILLSAKQQTFSVLFITKAGDVPVGDQRASSLQEAIAFATAWNLAGILTVIKPIQHCPRLVKYIGDAGCKCATYGTASNDPETVKIPSDAGLDTIITNGANIFSQTIK